MIAARPERPKAIMHQSAPVTSESAPTSTCSVATSAALFDQIVHAPSAIWQTISASQKIASFVSGSFRAKPFPGQPCRSNATQNSDGSATHAMNHLQLI